MPFRSSRGSAEQALEGCGGGVGGLLAFAKGELANFGGWGSSDGSLFDTAVDWKDALLSCTELLLLLY